MVLVDEQDVDIEQENVDHKKSEITMVLSKSEIDLVNWVPSKADHEGWIASKKHFAQVLKRLTLMCTLTLS